MKTGIRNVSPRIMADPQVALSSLFGRQLPLHGPQRRKFVFDAAALAELVRAKPPRE